MLGMLSEEAAHEPLRQVLARISSTLSVEFSREAPLDRRYHTFVLLGRAASALVAVMVVVEIVSVLVLMMQICSQVLSCLAGGSPLSLARGSGGTHLLADRFAGCTARIVIRCSVRGDHAGSRPRASRGGSRSSTVDRCTLPGERVALNLVQVVGMHGRCRVAVLGDLLVEGARRLQVEASGSAAVVTHAGSTAHAAARAGRLKGASAVLERVTRPFTSSTVERSVVFAGIGQHVSRCAGTKHEAWRN